MDLTRLELNYISKQHFKYYNHHFWVCLHGFRSVWFSFKLKTLPSLQSCRLKCKSNLNIFQESEEEEEKTKNPQLSKPRWKLWKRSRGQALPPCFAFAGRVMGTETRGSLTPSGCRRERSARRRPRLRSAPAPAPLRPRSRSHLSPAPAPEQPDRCGERREVPCDLGKSFFLSSGTSAIRSLVSILLQYTRLLNDAEHAPLPLQKTCTVLSKTSF